MVPGLLVPVCCICTVHVVLLMSIGQLVHHSDELWQNTEQSLVWGLLSASVGVKDNIVKAKDLRPKTKDLAFTAKTKDLAFTAKDLHYITLHKIVFRVPKITRTARTL